MKDKPNNTIKESIYTMSSDCFFHVLKRRGASPERIIRILT
ncbi:hypothetical protein CHCC14809_0240 [Bacillus licheniformis]|nr:hypothetical protein CHCC20442_3159 [Bacillus licheniformis]TWM22744.1 hypothetical protein CHCC15087_4414 [Bacillus licheniformis]TWM82502.1 hypothetical protein CHCC14809_0240 [Bacillus licheniformis]TWO10768.1 hypothetical protein CHCC14431_1408 [Bacillus licheniformis]